MKQSLQEDSLRIHGKMPDTVETPKEKLVRAVSDILHSKFCNPLAPFSKSTILALHITELTNLYRFLTSEIIESQNTPKRPKCPIKNPKCQSMARSDYKVAMIQYISEFGYTFRNNPCCYTPAFLEAFANYCERGMEKKKNNEL